MSATGNTNVRADWVDGALVIKDVEGNTLLTLDIDTVTFAAGALTSLAAAAGVTATADGLTTGIVPDGTAFRVVTSANAAHIVTLPTPTPGTLVILHVGSNGYELRSSAPATVAINGGAEADAESAIAAGTTVFAFCVTATAWKAVGVASDGTTAGVEAAAAA